MFGVGGGKWGVSQTAPATILSPQATQGGETDHFDRARRVVDLQKTHIDRVEIQVIKLWR